MIKYLTLLVAFLLVTNVALAQTPSPTSIRDAVKKQVDQELSTIKQAVAKKAYVGSISAKSDLSLTITNLKNQSRTATVTADSTIKLVGGKDGTPKDLKVGDFVIAMGDADSAGVLTVKRLLVIAAPPEDKRATVMVTVTKVASSTLTVEDAKKTAWTIKTSSTTKYTGETKSANIKVGSKIIATGSVSAANTLTTSFIHLLPSQ